MLILHYQGNRDITIPMVRVGWTGEARLDELFPDWETLLEFRDSKARRENRMRFMLGFVVCSLDVIQGRDLDDFNMRHYKVYDPNSVHRSSVMNLIYFRPKDGKHKDQLFRFSVAQREIRGDVNRMGPVVYSFIRLLLAGSCNFSEIVHYVICLGIDP